MSNKAKKETNIAELEVGEVGGVDIGVSLQLNVMTESKDKCEKSNFFPPFDRL